MKNLIHTRSEHWMHYKPKRKKKKFNVGGGKVCSPDRDPRVFVVKAHGEMLPPSDLIARRPSTPSLPIPVNNTPRVLFLKILAVE